MSAGGIANHQVEAERIYAESWASIRATDDISFKLMGAVPLLSGASLLTLFLKERITADRAPLAVLLSLFAAVITLGLFRWELRNIQTCSWMRRRVEALEHAVVTAAEIPRQPTPPQLVGKTEAEKAIYSLTIMAWLVMPAVAMDLAARPRLFGLHLVVAMIVGLLTLLSALQPVRVKPTGEALEEPEGPKDLAPPPTTAK
jgi:hypothetical protein